MPRPRQQPESALPVTTYEELDRYVGAFVSNALTLLVVVGAPGLQKSRVVREAVGPGACWIDGNATAFGTYRLLWEYRDRPVVLDDVDSLFADRAAVRLLKCLCQTEAHKTVAWHSDAATLDREGIPRAFRTSSRVVIIANVWRSLNLNVAAVEDRGHVLLFEPSALEVHLRTSRWFTDQEVFDFVGERLHLFANPSMRTYVKATELKRAGMGWRQFVLSRCLSGTKLLVARLKADPSFASEKDRERAFVEAGGGCRATYYNLARQLQAPAAAPCIVLAGRPAQQGGDLLRPSQPDQPDGRRLSG
jgi:hypothetical protein